VAGSDVFVFPSRTDTFGVVQLEALACGVPVAAYPVTGPLDVIGREPIGVLDEDLRAACMGALRVSRKACRNFALTKPWEASARQFLAHVERVAVGQSRKPHAA
jgi:glycosyltransferase involved in cell wall biosynthesis